MEGYQTTPIEEVKTENELKCTVSFSTTLSTAMGTVIGAGVFLKATSVAEVTGTASLHMFSWFLGGMISVYAGLTGAELTTAISEMGGMIKRIERIYENTAAFLPGWAQVVIYFPANVAALSIIFGTQFVSLFDLPQSMIIPITVTAAVSIMLIDFLGFKAGGVFQSITLICKLIPLFVIAIFGSFGQEGVDFRLFLIQVRRNLSFFPASGAGLLAAMLVYDGWIYVGNISGKLKEPAKDLPKTISLGTIGIMIVCLLVNAASLKTASIGGVVGDGNAASDVAKMVSGDFGKRLVTVDILISVYGTISGYTFIGVRLPYVVAKENNLPFSKLFVRLRDKAKVPVAAGIPGLVTAIDMMVVGGSDTLIDILIFVIWIFYTVVSVGVILLRKEKPDLIQPYKAPIYPFIPLAAVVGGVFIVPSIPITQTLLASAGIASILAGVPFYLYLKRRQQKIVWSSLEASF